MRTTISGYSIVRIDIYKTSEQQIDAANLSRTSVWTELINAPQEMHIPANCVPNHHRNDNAFSFACDLSTHTLSRPGVNVCNQKAIGRIKGDREGDPWNLAKIPTSVDMKTQLLSLMTRVSGVHGRDLP